jgi:hypothetical protein
MVGHDKYTTMPCGLELSGLNKFEHQPAAIIIVLIPNPLTILIFKKEFEYIVATRHSRF